MRYKRISSHVSNRGGFLATLEGLGRKLPSAMSATGRTPPITPGFPETQWSLVGLAAGPDGDQRQREALATLLRRYLPALRAQLVAARQFANDAIDDLLQGFVADKVIAQQL